MKETHRHTHSYKSENRIRENDTHTYKQKWNEREREREREVIHDVSSISFQDWFPRNNENMHETKLRVLRRPVRSCFAGITARPHDCTHQITIIFDRAFKCVRGDWFWTAVADLASKLCTILILHYGPSKTSLFLQFYTNWFTVTRCNSLPILNQCLFFYSDYVDVVSMSLFCVVQVVIFCYTLWFLQCTFSFHFKQIIDDFEQDVDLRLYVKNY